MQHCGYKGKSNIYQGIIQNQEHQHIQKQEQQHIQKQEQQHIRPEIQQVW